MTDDPQKSFFRPMLRQVVPDAILKEREIFLRLGPTAGPIYARLRLLDLIGANMRNTHRALPNTRSVLFVCFGNIMRSPMAETMMRQELENAGLQQTIAVASAGLHATPGKQAHPWALAVSEEIGLSLRGHRAKMITPEMVSHADAIFAMDFQNKAELLARFSDATTRILMLSAYAERAVRGHEISDPFFGNIGTTRHCYETIRTCIRNMVTEFSLDRKNSEQTSKQITLQHNQHADAITKE